MFHSSRDCYVVYNNNNNIILNENLPFYLKEQFLKFEYKKEDKRVQQGKKKVLGMIEF